MKKIYVGYLPSFVKEEDVKTLFEKYGKVISVELPTDRNTGMIREFGFVEMENGADEAINALDGFDYEGRKLKVHIAQPSRGDDRNHRRGW